MKLIPADYEDDAMLVVKKQNFCVIINNMSR